MLVALVLSPLHQRVTASRLCNKFRVARRNVIGGRKLETPGALSAREHIKVGLAVLARAYSIVKGWDVHRIRREVEALRRCPRLGARHV